MNVTDNVTIQGFGANRQAVNGNGTGRVFSIGAGVTASINDLTIFNGTSTNAGGGGIRNAGTLAINRCTVRNNVTINADGAGLFNTGNVTVNSSTFSNNTAGGAGGGLFNAGTAIIINSTFAGNSASYGGGLYDADTATMVVHSSTISGNYATFGGGIAAPLNSPTTEPSGITLFNTIVAANTFDSVNGLGPDLYGFFSAASSNNLIGALGFAKGMDPTKNLLGSIANATPSIDAKLSPLGNYGGATLTIIPQAGSPAIGGGNASLLPSGLSTDQRGFSRLSHGKLDIGAVQTGAKGDDDKLVFTSQMELVVSGKCDDGHGK